jgi:hypothetical protein
MRCHGSSVGTTLVWLARAFAETSTSSRLASSSAASPASASHISSMQTHDFVKTTVGDTLDSLYIQASSPPEDHTATTARVTTLWTHAPSSSATMVSSLSPKPNGKVKYAGVNIGKSRLRHVHCSTYKFLAGFDFGCLQDGSCPVASCTESV